MCQIGLTRTSIKKLFNHNNTLMGKKDNEKTHKYLIICFNQLSPHIVF